MIDITFNGVPLAPLGGQVLAAEIDRSAFLERTTSLSIEGSQIAMVADQVARQENLKLSYDYIIVGSGAAGFVVARRLAENRKNQVLLLEAGDMDLKPNVLIAENWYFNQGGPMDWSFAVRPSAAMNNRSLHQAMGKSPGGETSINETFWALGHKNDFQPWANEVCLSSTGRSKGLFAFNQDSGVATRVTPDGATLWIDSGYHSTSETGQAQSNIQPVKS